MLKGGVVRRQGSRSSMGRIEVGPRAFTLGPGWPHVLQIALKTLLPIVFTSGDGIFHALHPAIDFVINALQTL